MWGGGNHSWVEEEITFSVDGTELRGLLTVPVAGGPHLAVVIVTGSVDVDGAVQSGVSHPLFTDLAQQLAGSGYAAFRYDSRAVEHGAGDTTITSLEATREEAVAALRVVKARSDIRPELVGLWGSSQEAWAISMVAADHPDEVAFIVAVSGAGISVAEQQVWGIESQSRAAGLSPDDVERAVLFGRLIVDWQLTDPLFQDTNQETIDRLGG